MARRVVAKLIACIALRTLAERPKAPVIVATLVNSQWHVRPLPRQPQAGAVNRRPRIVRLSNARHNESSNRYLAGNSNGRNKPAVNGQ
jgi:hypothetical protein